MSALKCACGGTAFTVDLPKGIDPKSADWVTYQLGEDGLLACSKCGRSPMDAITETP